VQRFKALCSVVGIRAVEYVETLCEHLDPHPLGQAGVSTQPQIKRCKIESFDGIASDARGTIINVSVEVTIVSSQVKGRREPYQIPGLT